MNKKVWIVCGILAVLLVIGIVLSVTTTKKQEPKSEYQSEFDMVVQTRVFLKSKINYPETFDYVAYPNVEWFEDEMVFVVISGQFKCANAFNVYSTYKFAVAMNPKNFAIISYKIM